MYLAFSAMLIAVMEKPVMADDLGLENVTDIDEISSFGSKWGAEMRLLQLSYSIEKNILWGNEIIANIKEINSSYDTSDLEAIIVELETLRDEVAEINASTGEEAAREFVEAKAEAIDLTQQFRKEVYAIIPPGERNEIRKNLTNVSNNRLRNLSANIAQNMFKFNTERVERLLSDLNISNPELMERITSGNITKKELTDQLKDLTKNVSRLIKPRHPGEDAVPPLPGMAGPPLPDMLKEGMQRDRIFFRAVEDAKIQDYLNKTAAKLEKRLEKAQNMNLSPEVLARVEYRLNNTNGKVLEIRNRMVERVGFAENLTQRKLEIIDIFSEKIGNKTEELRLAIQERLQEGNLTDEQKTMLEERLRLLDNKTDKLNEVADKRMNHTMEAGARMVDRLEKINDKALGQGGKQ